MFSARLRRVESAHFGMSEATMFMKLPAQVRNDLGPNDVVCFVSMTLNQVLFIWKIQDLPAPKRKVKSTKRKKWPNAIFRSVRLRMTGGDEWNPVMLADYAEKCGIKLIGLPSFKEFYEEHYVN